jgi:hypothetical protein
MSSKRGKIRQPFVYGVYLIEYRDTPDSLLKILKEKIDTFEDAQQHRERLILKGCHDAVIRKVR